MLWQCQNGGRIWFSDGTPTPNLYVSVEKVLEKQSINTLIATPNREEVVAQYQSIRPNGHEVQRVRAIKMGAWQLSQKTMSQFYTNHEIQLSPTSHYNQRCLSV